MHGYEGTTVGVSNDDEAVCDESYYQVLMLDGRVHHSHVAVGNIARASPS